MFCSGFSESEKNEIEIDDIQPDTFRVFIQWLYGQSFEKVKESVLRKQDDFTTDQESYETYCLNFLICLLKVTDIYSVKQLKNIIKSTIIGSYLSVHNVCEILEWSKKCEASQLKDYCILYIKSNRELIIE